MSLDSVYITGIILTGLAVVLDVWVIRWVRRNWQADESSPHVRVLGSYSPILTWLKYRRLLTWKRRGPSVAATSFAPSVSRIETPAASAFNPELSHRSVLIMLLLSAVGLTALGQQIFIRAPETRATGLPFIVGGVGLFVLGRHLYLTRALPNWLNALSARLRITPFQLILLLLAGMSAYAARFFAGNDAKMLNPLAAVASWLAALGLVMTGSYDFGAGRNSSAVSEALGPSWGRREMFAMAALMIFAFLVRAVANGEIPHVLTGDEGSAGLAAVDILEGRFNNPFIVSWFSFPSLFFFAPAVSIGIWGQTYEALRLPSAFAGALTVGGLYWLARSMFGRGVAGVSAAMLATLNFHVHFSRIGLNNIWDGLFAVLALGMLWRGWLSGRRSHFVGAGLLVGLSHYFYTSSTVVPLMMLAWLTLAAAVNWRRARPRLPELFFLVVAAVVTIMPLALFYLKFPNQFFAPMARFSILSGDWLEYTSRVTGEPGWRLILNNYWQAAQGFTSVPLRAWYGSGKPMLLALPAGLFILGVTLAFFNLRDARYWLLLLWLAGVISIGALTESAPAGQRYIIGAPVAVLMAAIPLVTMARWIIEVWPRTRSIVSGIVVGVVILIMVLDLRFYFGEYAPTLGQGDPNGQVATTLGQRLRRYPAGTRVYFFGAPRMYYYGFSTIPFLAPQAQGEEVVEVITAPPDWSLAAPRTVFVFLPERQNELAFVEQRYPGGASQWFYARDGAPLFLLYEVGLP